MVIPLFILIIAPLSASAQDCTYACNDMSVHEDDASFCAGFGGTVGAVINLGGHAAATCAGQTHNCSMYSKPVCCCNSTLAGSSRSITTPKFEIPEFQVKINNEKLSKVSCFPNDDGSYFCSIPWIGEYIVMIYDYALSIAGILAAVMLMIGGLLWLVSGGDVSKITQAREIIVGAIVGLLILAVSFLLLNQLNPKFTTFDPIMIGTIKENDLEPLSYEGNPDNSIECNDCVKIENIPYKDGGLVNSGLYNKLQKAWNNTPNNLRWMITEAYPPVIKHKAKCHNNGMCVDIDFTVSYKCKDVDSLIKIIEDAGMKVFNEFYDCNGAKTPQTTGTHLHVY